MPGIGTTEPKKKKQATIPSGRVYKPSDAIIDQLRTPTLERKDIKKPKLGGILSEDGKKLAMSREYET
jgi:hypothetical protein